MTISSRLKTNFFQVWEHLLQTTRRSRAALTGEQIARRSWAKKVYNFEELPQAFQSPVLEIIRGKQTLPYAVLTPTFEGYLKRENEKLVFCLDNRLFFLENDGQNITVTHYEYKNIYRIEFGEILLKAWIKFFGIDDKGVYSTTALRFNSVTDFLLNPFIEAVRHSDKPAIQVDIQQEREKFSSLKWSHFKFMNYARNSLLPGERVIQYIFQPEMKATRTSLFGVTLFKRTLCLSHLLIQTDHELILIRDEQTSQRERDVSRYGGIWNYVPINQLQDLIIEDDSDGMVNLTIRLPAGDFLHMPCAIERRPELEQFVQNVKEAIKYPIPSIS